MTEQPSFEALGIRMEQFSEADVRREQAEKAVADLELISRDEVAWARLHPVERMMVRDVLGEPRHLHCLGCIAWMRKLVRKAKGETA